jgi:hypothetical protein
MLSSNQHVIARWMRWAGRIIGLGAAGLLLIMLIGGALSEGLGQNIAEAIQGISLGVLGLMALAGCIASWRWERLAAILLVSTALGLGIHIGVCAGRNHLLAWSIIGLPYLVAGTLIFSSWRLSRQNQPRAT